MKNKLKRLVFVFFMTAVGFTLCAQSRDPRPSTPQPMTTKTALEYFKDEGIRIGINVGNSLDAVDSWTNQRRPVAIETAWGNPAVNQEYLNGLKKLGFDIVRIPVTWVGHIGSAPDYKVNEAWLRRVAEVVNMAHNAGLKCFINIHHDGNHGTGGGWLLIDKAPKDPSITEKFEKVWKQIAEYFINYGDNLMFQAFNEIHRGDWNHVGTADEYAIINDWNQRFTNVVRSTGGNNSKRYLLYYGYMTSYTIGGSDYSKFKLPSDGTNRNTRQIVGFHYYYPYDFSLEAKNYIWDTQDNRNHLESAFAAFKTNFIDSGIPVIIGETGPARYVKHKKNGNIYKAANTETAKQNRLLYAEYLFGKARENSIVPFYWDNGTYPKNAQEGDFSVINRINGTPNSPENAEVIQRMMNAVK